MYLNVSVFQGCLKIKSVKKWCHRLNFHLSTGTWSCSPRKEKCFTLFSSAIASRIFCICLSQEWITDFSPGFRSTIKYWQRKKLCFLSYYWSLYLWFTAYVQIKKTKRKYKKPTKQIQTNKQTPIPSYLNNLPTGV